MLRNEAPMTTVACPNFL
uniref:Uncharacterized protein n=1 Tax=Lepeophtheirus salmonis TaxID=72036 RepID=A0A0K2VAC6_LEPSM